MNPTASDIKWTSYYTLGFSREERDELIALLPYKWAERVRNAHGILTYENMPSFEPRKDMVLIDRGSQPSGLQLS